MLHENKNSYVSHEQFDWHTVCCVKAKAYVRDKEWDKHMARIDWQDQRNLLIGMALCMAVLLYCVLS